MAHGRLTPEIVRVRSEILVALRMIYPAALRSEQLLRSLLSVFPTLEWQHLKRELYYLLEKGHIQRVIAGSETEQRLTPWRKRWFRITAIGKEVAESMLDDGGMDS